MSRIGLQMKAHEIEYETGGSSTTSEIIALFESSGINRPTKEPERIARMFSASNLVVTARCEGKLVGICRSLTDFAYCCYVSDLAVDRDYQRQGIGEALLTQTRQAVGDEVTIVLVSAPGAKDFYPKVGFQPTDAAFLVRRKR